MSGYKWTVPEFNTVFAVERIRRERQELIGELSVRCEIAGARTVNGYLSTGDFNFSSVRARSERAKLLHERARTNGKIDWYALLEEFTQGVFEQEREGDPDVDLRTLQRPIAEDHNVRGIVFPKKHPTIIFGDGGTGKSTLALYIAGQLATDGLKVGFFDWELSGEDHRDRLELLFGSNMPLIHYVRCERPLVAEVDRLQRVTRDRILDFAIIDSVAFACDGRPEDAEVASRYFRSIRQLGIGTLQIAHVSKSSEENDKKPFGSVFFHNGARSTWYIARKNEDADIDQDLRIALFHRKCNLGRLRREVGLLLSWTSNAISVENCEVADTPEFSVKLSIWKRTVSALQKCPKSVRELMEEVGCSEDSLERTLRRHKKDYIELSSGNLALVDRREK